MEATRIRTLTPKELEIEQKQKKDRTEYERRAYRLLPKSMKQCVQRNPGVGFEGHFAFYPDLFFPKERICIEIDGGIHLRQKEEDDNKDRIFRDNGYEVIRIKNADTIVDIAFWQCLLDKLCKIEVDGIRDGVKPFVAELRRMIADKWNMCLTVDNEADGYTEEYSMPFMDHQLMRRRLNGGYSLTI